MFLSRLMRRCQGCTCHFRQIGSETRAALQCVRVDGDATPQACANCHSVAFPAARSSNTGMRRVRISTWMDAISRCSVQIP